MNCIAEDRKHVAVKKHLDVVRVPVKSGKTMSLEFVCLLCCLSVPSEELTPF